METTVSTRNKKILQGIFYIDW